MLTKTDISQLKFNVDELKNLIQNQNEIKKVVFILENLGKLPKNFNYDFLLELLSNKNEKIRYLAIKNIAKLENLELLNTLYNIAKVDESTNVRREAVSAIGRMRHKLIIKKLVDFLNDNDPKVIMQAIRGLLTFKDEIYVKENLKKLFNHPNEMIQQVLNKEFNEKEVNKSKYSHIESPDYMKNAVVLGDVLETLKYVQDDSIHLTFTSPPYYNARDYSIYQSYQEYLDFLEKVFKEVHRITKEGRFFILNTSPVIVQRMSRSHSSKRYPIPYDIHPLLIKMGWEFIDDIIWVKPEASVKNRNAGFLQHRKPLAYKPNPCSESIMVYRKKTDKLLDWNMKQYPEEIIEKSKIKGNYETSNIWKIDPTFDKTHSAVFPIELCNRVIKFYSFIGDLVFDPFGGSGTFGESALKSNRYFFLTEKDKFYFERIKEKLSNDFLFIDKKNKFIDLDEFKKLFHEELNDTNK
ncbi:MAG: DNA methyltransferase [Bryobacteraceae bacterium]